MGLANRMPPGGNRVVTPRPSMWRSVFNFVPCLNARFRPSPFICVCVCVCPEVRKLRKPPCGRGENAVRCPFPLHLCVCVCVCVWSIRILLFARVHFTFPWPKLVVEGLRGSGSPRPRLGRINALVPTAAWREGVRS